MQAEEENDMSASATNVLPAQVGRVRGWPRWAPFAAVVWSLVYAILGLYWAVSGRGFPFSPALVTDATGPLAGRFGSSRCHELFDGEAADE